MFKCGLCQSQSERGETAVRVITEVEPAVYPFRSAVHNFMVGHSSKTKDDPGGVGQQIVKEVLAHALCAKKFTTPKVIVRDERS